MPSNILWRGDATAVAQINTITFAGTWLTTETVTVAINGKTVVTITGSATIATLIATIQAALAASAIPEFKEITWTNTATTIVATAATPGIPFTILMTTNSASGTINASTSTAGTATVVSSGPADASTLANYSTGILPVTGDSLFFTGNANPCMYGLSALSGVTLAVLVKDMSHTGVWGLPYTNPSGYIEYRQRYLQAPATVTTIGNGPGNGAGRINLDSGSVQTTLTVNGSASPTDSGYKTISWKGTNASNVVNLNKGSFAAAFFETEAATIATLNQGYQTNQAGDVDAFCGPGCTLTTINKTGGKLSVNSSFTTLNQGPGNAGTTRIVAGTPGTLVVTGGTVVYVTGGNYTAITTTDSGYVDFAQGTAAVTGTNTTCNPGQGGINDPGKRITFTNPVLLTGQLSDYPNLDLGANFHIARS
jgi:hypothetical protein